MQISDFCMYKQKLALIITYKNLILKIVANTVSISIFNIILIFSILNFRKGSQYMYYELCFTRYILVKKGDFIEPIHKYLLPFTTQYLLKMRMNGSVIYLNSTSCKKRDIKTNTLTCFCTLFIILKLEISHKSVPFTRCCENHSCSRPQRL